MSPQKQRVAIAIACGLQNVAPVVIQNVKHQGDDITVGISSDSGWIPDYLNDLNACHEAEKVLNSEQSYEYYVQLSMKVNRPFIATAPQRCEAFLRTLGLWEEEQ